METSFLASWSAIAVSRSPTHGLTALSTESEAKLFVESVCSSSTCLSLYYSHTFAQGSTLTDSGHVLRRQPTQPDEHGGPASFPSPSFSVFHPTLPLCAFGWSDGCLTLWSDLTATAGPAPAYHMTSGHRAPITALRFAQGGSLLISGDSQGSVALWEVVHDPEGYLVSPLQTYSRSGAVTHITLACADQSGASFVGMPPSASTQRDSQPAPFHFFVGYSKGLVCRCNESGAIANVFSTHASLSLLAFYSPLGSGFAPTDIAGAADAELLVLSGRALLVALTTSGELHAYRVPDPVAPALFHRALATSPTEGARASLGGSQTLSPTQSPGPAISRQVPPPTEGADAADATDAADAESPSAVATRLLSVSSGPPELAARSRLNLGASTEGLVATLLPLSAYGRPVITTATAEADVLRFWDLTGSLLQAGASASAVDGSVCQLDALVMAPVEAIGNRGVAGLVDTAAGLVVVHCGGLLSLFADTTTRGAKVSFTQIGAVSGSPHLASSRSQTGISVISAAGLGALPFSSAAHVLSVASSDGRTHLVAVRRGLFAAAASTFVMSVPGIPHLVACTGAVHAEPRDASAIRSSPALHAPTLAIAPDPIDASSVAATFPSDSAAAIAGFLDSHISRRTNPGLQHPDLSVRESHDYSVVSSRAVYARLPLLPFDPTGVSVAPDGKHLAVWGQNALAVFAPASKPAFASAAQSWSQVGLATVPPEDAGGGIVYVHIADPAATPSPVCVVTARSVQLRLLNCATGTQIASARPGCVFIAAAATGASVAVVDSLGAIASWSLARRAPRPYGTPFAVNLWSLCAASLPAALRPPADVGESQSPEEAAAAAMTSLAPLLVSAEDDAARLLSGLPLQAATVPPGAGFSLRVCSLAVAADASRVVASLEYAFTFPPAAELDMPATGLAIPSAAGPKLPCRRTVACALLSSSEAQPSVGELFVLPHSAVGPGATAGPSPPRVVFDAADLPLAVAETGAGQAVTSFYVVAAADRPLPDSADDGSDLLASLLSPTATVASSAAMGSVRLPDASSPQSIVALRNVYRLSPSGLERLAAASSPHLLTFLPIGLLSPDAGIGSPVGPRVSAAPVVPLARAMIDYAGLTDVFASLSAPTAGAGASLLDGGITSERESAQALMEFSRCLALGAVEEAFRLIRRAVLPSRGQTSFAAPGSTDAETSGSGIWRSLARLALVKAHVSMAVGCFSAIGDVVAAMICRQLDRLLLDSAAVRGEAAVDTDVGRRAHRLASDALQGLFLRIYTGDAPEPALQEVLASVSARAANAAALARSSASGSEARIAADTATEVISLAQMCLSSVLPGLLAEAGLFAAAYRLTDPASVSQSRARAPRASDDTGAVENTIAQTTVLHALATDVAAAQTDRAGALALFAAAGTLSSQIAQLAAPAGSFSDAELEDACVDSCALSTESTADVPASARESRDALRWLGQLAESQADRDTAVRRYEMAADGEALCRMVVAEQGLDAASNWADSLSQSLPFRSAAAHLHIAQVCDAEQRFADAAVAYSRAGCPDMAARRALASGNASLAASVAADPGISRTVALEVASYLESSPAEPTAVPAASASVSANLECAAALYAKHGCHLRALEMFLEHEQLVLAEAPPPEGPVSGPLAVSLEPVSAPYAGSTGLAQLAAGLDVGSVAVDAARHLAKGFVTRATALASPSPAGSLSQAEEQARQSAAAAMRSAACSLLLCAQDAVGALALVASGEVELTPELADRLAPVPTDDASEEDKQRAAQLQLGLAKAARKNGQLRLACKLYTRAGDKPKAAKCLIAAGDVTKLLFFANMSRSREVFILTANHLQTLDWRSNRTYLKAIVKFYGKARAWMSLSRFYQTCANQEIDEFRDYSKALAALKEAAGAMQRAVADATAATHEQIDAAQQEISLRVQLVERFLRVRKLAAEHSDSVRAACDDLLADPDLDKAIRRGDVFAMLIELYYYSGDIPAAASVLSDMRSHGLNLAWFVDDAIVAAISGETGRDEGEIGPLGTVTGDDLSDEELTPSDD
jgi:hypothetical protein